MKKAAAAKPVVILKGGRTQAGTRAVMSHTASLAGSFEVFDALCRQVNAVRVNSVEEMVDLAVAFRFMDAPKGPGVAVVGGGGGFSVFAADEIDDAGLECPILPEHTQEALREFTPAAGTSVRNPVDTIALFQPPGLQKTLQIIGEAENIDVVMFHTSFSWGNMRRNLAAVQDIDPAAYMDSMVQQMTAAREALRHADRHRPPTALERRGHGGDRRVPGAMRARGLPRLLHDPKGRERHRQDLSLAPGPRRLAVLSVVGRRDQPPRLCSHACLCD